MGKLFEGLLGLGIASFILHEVKGKDVPNYYAMSCDELAEQYQKQRKQNRKKKPVVSWDDDGFDDDENKRERYQANSEKEIFRAFPLPQQARSSSKKLRAVSLHCKSCNGRMEFNNGERVLFCPYCGEKNFILEDSDVTVEKIRCAAYRDVELGKQRTYERIALEREKSKRRNNTDRDSYFSYIVGIIMLLIAVFLLLAPRLFETKEKNKESHVDEVKIPVAYSNYVGDNYTAVVYALKSAGFKNVSTKGLEDLKLGLFDKDGEVEKVYINGNSTFSAHTWFPNNAEILVTYHSFKNK